jgi:hypothetical protein
MRFSSLFLLSWYYQSAAGFVSPSVPSRQSTSLGLTAEEAAQRAAAAASAALKEAPQPKLFEDDLLDDMQQCLLKLERRVKNGAGALSLLEVEEFEFATRRILDEMKLNEHNRPKPAPAFPNVQVEETPKAAAVAPPAAAAPVAATPPQVQNNNQKVMDISNDEGPTYDGTGGMGLAKGTTNTYIIDGMDEMSPEEYQKALQKSISDRQARRVREGTYGNRNSNDYLSALGAAGTAKKPYDPKNPN